MNTSPSHSSILPEPGEHDIRSYAYQLYLQSGSVPDRDFDNWLEATACLKARIALDQTVPHPHGAFTGLESDALHSLPPFKGGAHTPHS